MDNPRLFTGSIRNHPAGIAPDSLIRLSPSPCGQKNPSGVLQENSARIKLHFNIHFTGFESWDRSLHTGSAFLRPPSSIAFLRPLSLLPSFSSTLFLSPSRRSLVFGPPLPVYPSSHPSLILSFLLRHPRYTLTFATFLSWTSISGLPIPIGRCADIRPPPCAYSAATPSGVHR